MWLIKMLILIKKYQVARLYDLLIWYSIEIFFQTGKSGKEHEISFCKLGKGQWIAMENNQQI